LTRDEPNLLAGFWASSAKARSRGYVSITQPGRDCSRQV